VKRSLPLLLILAIAPAWGPARASDSLTLERLVPPTGTVNGFSAHEASRHAHLDASNSVQAQLSYQLDSSERGAVNVKLQTPARQFVEIDNPIHRGSGTVRPRFTVLCEPNSPPEQLVQRISFTLAAVDEQGHWLRTLVSVDRAVSFRFRCSGAEENAAAALPPRAFALDMSSGQTNPYEVTTARRVSKHAPIELRFRPTTST